MIGRVRREGDKVTKEKNRPSPRLSPRLKPRLLAEGYQPSAARTPIMGRGKYIQKADKRRLPCIGEQMIVGTEAPGNPEGPGGTEEPDGRTKREDEGSAPSLARCWGRIKRRNGKKGQKNEMGKVGKMGRMGWWETGAAGRQEGLGGAGELGRRTGGEKGAGWGEWRENEGEFRVDK